MSEHSPQGESDRPLDPELEARLVALALGEASDFERDELERLIATRPEVQECWDEIQQVHGLLEEVSLGELFPPADEWKLSKDKRELVTATLDGRPVVQMNRADDNVARRSFFRRASVWRFASVAAVVCGIAGLVTLMLPVTQFARNSARLETASAASERAPSKAAAIASEKSWSDEHASEEAFLKAKQAQAALKDSVLPFYDSDNDQVSGRAAGQSSDDLKRLYGVESAVTEDYTVHVPTAVEDASGTVRYSAVQPVVENGMAIRSVVPEGIKREHSSSRPDNAVPDVEARQSVSYFTQESYAGSESDVASRPEAQPATLLPLPPGEAGAGGDASRSAEYGEDAKSGASQFSTFGLGRDGQQVATGVMSGGVAADDMVSDDTDPKGDSLRFRAGNVVVLSDGESQSEAGDRKQSRTGPLQQWGTSKPGSQRGGQAEGADEFAGGQQQGGQQAQVEVKELAAIDGTLHRGDSGVFGNDGYGNANSGSGNGAVGGGAYGGGGWMYTTEEERSFGSDGHSPQGEQNEGGVFEVLKAQQDYDSGGDMKPSNSWELRPNQASGVVNRTAAAATKGPDYELDLGRPQDNFGGVVERREELLGKRLTLPSPTLPRSLETPALTSSVAGERDKIDSLSQQLSADKSVLTDSMLYDRATTEALDYGTEQSEESQIKLQNELSLMSAQDEYKKAIAKFESKLNEQNKALPAKAKGMVPNQSTAESGKPDSRNSSDVMYANDGPNVLPDPVTSSVIPEWAAPTQRSKDRRIGGTVSNTPKLSKLVRSRRNTKAAPAPGLNEKDAAKEAFSTFSLHVGDVSFKLARAALAKGQWPEAGKIRIEEFVNAFDYGDPLPCHGEKVACALEQSIHPFLQQRNMLRVSMRTAATGRSSTTPLRLTFLLDNSGSMERIDRRQTVRRAFALLAQQLKPIDQVTLISFARGQRLMADKVPGTRAKELVKLIEDLPSEGGTNIEDALLVAYQKAKEQQLESAQNRIILLTDGAVNLGNADPEGLSRMIASMRDEGIAFDAAGISAEGLNDEVLEALTRQGDGRYYLLDSAESVDDSFAKQIAGALRPSAKNVKVQVEFNPDRVGRYKLLGFEKHRLKKEDFRNDTVDAAEMAAAEAGVAMYQFQAKPTGSGDVGTVSVRFRDIATGQMVEHRWPIPYEPNASRIQESKPSVRVATIAAMFAAKLSGKPDGHSVGLSTLTELINSLPPQSRSQKRVQELEQMIQQTRQIMP